MKVLLNRGAEVKMAASVDRERFGQERLEHYYKKMTKKLSPWKHVILFVQHVLTWKKPPFSLLLFAVVHWVFYQYVVGREGVVSLLLKLCLAGAVCDMIVRMATAKGDGQESSTRRRGLRGVTEALREKVGRKMDLVTFEQAVVESHCPRPYGTVLPFALVCLKLAQVSLWFEMTWLALLVKWGESPSSVASLAIALGVSLMVVAKVLPGVVLAYLLVMMGLVWPYVECHHVLNLLVAKIRPWLDMVEWGQLKAKVFTEEGQADYDFALGGDMTADAFARAVRGQRGGAPPPPHPHASGPGDAPSSTVPPVPEQPFPEGGSSLAQGPPQASPEASLAELDPQYDSLLVDLVPRLEYMPSISHTEMGTIDEGSGSDLEGLPELDEYDYHSHTPGGGASHVPAQPRKRKKRRLPMPKLRRKSDRPQDTSTEGNPLEYPPRPGYYTPSGSDTPSAPPMLYHSTPLDPAAPPPSYEEATRLDGTTAYAGYYRQQGQQPF